LKSGVIFYWERKRLQIIHLIHFPAHKFLNFPILAALFISQQPLYSLFRHHFSPINRKESWRRKFSNCLLLGGGAHFISASCHNAK